ncbi:MAG: nucleotidyltransferase domain-containing protein [Deltaproteobacteria bacterium]|nr:nucleotidyltransferase domain-containing protein [Deltaproteobacteria bacterium]
MAEPVESTLSKVEGVTCAGTCDVGGSWGREGAPGDKNLRTCQRPAGGPSPELEKERIAVFGEFKPQTLLLFGSFARGDWDDESDIDLIVVYDTPKRFLDRLEELYLAWTGTRAIDILAYTPAEFEQMLRESAFLQDVVAEAKVLYECAKFVADSASE